MSWFTRIFGNADLPDAKQQEVITVDSMPDGTTNIDVDDTNVLGGFNILRQDIAALPQTEQVAIERYRKISIAAEIDDAINEIVNETFNVDGDTPAISLSFKPDTKLSVQIQEKITEAYKYVYHDLFDFDGTGKNLFRSWYIDSRLFLHKVVDEKGKTIKKLQQIDPLNMRRVRVTDTTQDGFVDLSKETIKYFYTPNQYRKNLWTADWNSTTYAEKKKNAAVFEHESIAYSDSGIVAADGNYIISHLHKAIVPYNNMKMMESAMVIYRVVRAPERRVFYVDIADLPKQRAEKYMNDLISKFKNKMVYDNATGETVDKRNMNSMLEDIWLPRRANGRSTEVSTLQGGQNVGVTEDVEYCRDIFYRALNVPRSRFSSEQNPFGSGRVTEITRDEARFLKFIESLRQRFMLVVEDVLRTELMLRNVIKAEDWKEILRDISWIYAEDNNLVELKQNEILSNRIEALNSMSNLVGTYFSSEWAMKNVMKMTDDDIKEMKEAIAEDNKNNSSNDPFSDDDL